MILWMSQHAILFLCYSKSKHSLIMPKQLFCLICKKTFICRRLQGNEFVAVKHLSHWLHVAFFSRHFFPLLATAHGLCNINHQNSSLDVICCCVAFNNDKMKMYPTLKDPLFKVGIMSRTAKVQREWLSVCIDLFMLNNSAFLRVIL